MLGASWLALPWIDDLARSLGPVFALFAFGGLALLPGYLAAFLFASVLLESRERLRLPRHWPTLHVLIAAWNEEEGIIRTLRALSRSSYPGEMRVLIADDGSSDRTLTKALGAANVSCMQIDVLPLSHAGKAAALNSGLEEIDGEWVLVLDADTEVMPGAPARLLARLLQSPSDVAAVAGSLLVDGPGAMRALQSWDYRLGISMIKLSQSTLRATLVAQGAFSVYRRSFLLSVDPWLHSSGEDIVLSWQILQRGSILFEPTAFARTHPPSSLPAFWRQRVRWARGMIEGLRDSGKDLLKGSAGTRHGVATNMLFPWVDSAYTFAFLPGVVLLFFGEPLLVGLWTALLLPLQIFLFSLYRLKSRRHMKEAGISSCGKEVAFWCYLLFYQALLSPAALWGYLSEVLRRKRRW